MTEKELRRLSRGELMELLLKQSIRMHALEERLEQAEKALEKRELTQLEAGTMAEAALKLNNVFQAADEACKQYIENIQRLNREMEERNRS